MRKKKRNLIIFGLIVLSIIFAGLYKHHLKVQKEQDFYKKQDEEIRMIKEEARQKIEEFEKMDLAKLSSEERRKQEEINRLYKRILKSLIEVEEKSLERKRRIDIFRKLPVPPVKKKKTVYDLGFGPKLTRALGDWELLSNDKVVFVKKDIYKKGYSCIFKGTIRNISRRPQEKVYVVWAFLYGGAKKDFRYPVSVVTEYSGGRVTVKEIDPLFIDIIDYLDKGAEADFCITVYSYSGVIGSLNAVSFNDIERAIKDGEYYVGIYKAGTF